MELKGLIVYERKAKSPEDIVRHKEELLRVLKVDYKRIVSSGKQLGSKPIVPMMFLLGITGKLLLIPNIEVITTEKREIRGVLKALVKSYRERGNPITYFCHFTEALVLVLKKGTPQHEYYERTGKIFPGTKKKTNFCITEETLTSCKVTMFKIDPETGEFTLNKDGGESSPSREEYGGSFSHLVYRPEDAEDLGGSVEIIGLGSKNSK